MQLNMTKRGVLSRLFINSFRADREKAALGMSARVPDLNLARSQGKSPYRAVYRTKRGQTSRFTRIREGSTGFLTQVPVMVKQKLGRSKEFPVSTNRFRSLASRNSGNVVVADNPNGKKLRAFVLRSFSPR